MDESLKKNLLSAEHWLRFFYMALFLFGLYIAAFVVFVVIVAQCTFALITGSDNLKLRAFGSSLSSYIKSVLSFLTFNSNEKPFPFYVSSNQKGANKHNALLEKKYRSRNKFLK